MKDSQEAAAEAQGWTLSPCGGEGMGEQQWVGRTTAQCLLSGEEMSEGSNTEWQESELMLVSPFIPGRFVSPIEDGDRKSQGEGCVCAHRNLKRWWFHS